MLNRFKTLVLLIMLVVLLPLSLKAQKIEFTEFDLPNGLHVILHQNNSVPIVAINITYHVGSKNEKTDRTGFAHFFEHLMFEGSENIGRGKYSNFIQNAGGNYNAGTSFDQTAYYETLPSNQLELGLWLESERLFHLKIDSIGIETQRKVIKEERKERYENQPYGRLWLEVFRNTFNVHPYKRMPIGEVQYIDQAKYTEFMDFYRQYYVPQNAVLVIAGDIQIESTKNLVKKYFETIPKGTIPQSRPLESEPAKTLERRADAYDKVQLPIVVYSYLTPAMGTPDSYALDMLQKWISGGKSSVLYKSLVDQKQLALEVDASPYSLEDAGLFVTLGVANIGKSAEELDKAMNAEIEKALETEISDQEFQKIKNQIENDFYSKNSTMQGIASSLAEYHTYFKNANLINTEIEKYGKITKEDIKRVAKRYLTPGNRMVLYYLPETLKK